MCIATVVERSRTSARPPGRFTERVSGAPAGPTTLRHTRPTGLRSVPPPGPATPVTPTPTSAPQASAGAFGERLRDLRRDRAVALDQLGGHAGELEPWPSLEYATIPPRT